VFAAGNVRMSRRVTNVGGSYTYARRGLGRRADGATAYIALLARIGFHGFSLDVFKPSVVFAGGFGLSLMLAFGSFVGFEATARSDGPWELR
jgi:hypothetical protein